MVKNRIKKHAFNKNIFHEEIMLFIDRELSYEEAEHLLGLLVVAGKATTEANRRYNRTSNLEINTVIKTRSDGFTFNGDKRFMVLEYPNTPIYNYTDKFITNEV